MLLNQKKCFYIRHLTFSLNLKNGFVVQLDRTSDSGSENGGSNPFEATSKVPLIMPISIINSIASWLIKKRLHEIELFIKYPVEVQNEWLLNIVNTAKDTEFGQKYMFNEITNYSSMFLYKIMNH